MCKLYTSLFLPFPRVIIVLSIATIVRFPEYVPIFQDCRLSYGSVLFKSLFILDLICLTSMLKRGICNMAWAHLTETQHVLIKKIFGIFAVSCTVHVN
uniref:Uncharacterized protein n=1 Tax=Anguilla anguilla TaxID=7936 RepID=A0A0E9X1B2_ANGAN